MDTTRLGSRWFLLLLPVMEGCNGRIPQHERQAVAVEFFRNYGAQADKSRGRRRAEAIEEERSETGAVWVGV